MFKKFHFLSLTSSPLLFPLIPFMLLLFLFIHTESSHTKYSIQNFDLGVGTEYILFVYWFAITLRWTIALFHSGKAKLKKPHYYSQRAYTLSPHLQTQTQLTSRMNMPFQYSGSDRAVRRADPGVTKLGPNPAINSSVPWFPHLEKWQITDSTF